MPITVDIKVPPVDINDWNKINQLAVKKSQQPSSNVQKVILLKKSIDARGRQPIFQLRLEVYTTEESIPEPISYISLLKNKHLDKKVLVIGAGPTGYFAALELLELGLKPIILERGKDVQQRRRDLRGIQQFGEVNPDSNYCFGEGGAGTYSDGKLYTRSQKRGNIEKALKLLVEHGAQSDILVDAHPHIGSNKLPKVVAQIRETILSHGGEILFNHRVTDFMIKNEKILGVQVNNEMEIQGDAIILATGHSARDIYQLCHQKGIRLESKPFALGVRIEHPQPLIDEIQYNQRKREEDLPAASYKLVSQVKGRGVFSFCMCPGGLVVPAATSPGEIVVNGMSLSRRDSPYANSGTVTAVEEKDFAQFADQGVFAGMAFQKSVEQKMFSAGDGTQKAPAQRLTDFVKGKVSNDLPSTSYIPGLLEVPLHSLLPDFIYQHLREGVQNFGRKMKGYFTEEANVIGTESRTSSPLRIPRDPKTFMHPGMEALFPAGEGAGFAGGIISAAMDGQKVARAVNEYLQ